jgi:methyl coenzyme M reductase beta subunit
MGARGGAGTGCSPVRESMCESEKRTRCSVLQGIREDLAVTEGVFGRHNLAHGREVEYDILTDSNLTVSTISIHLNVLVCFGKDSTI